MGFILGLLLDAALIGIIIAGMKRSDFPGWEAMIWVVLAIGLTNGVVSALLPGPLGLLGIPAGAAVGAYVIQYHCNMSIKRGMIAAGIFLGIRMVLGLVWMGIFGA